jgi:hypothetical protein
MNKVIPLTTVKRLEFNHDTESNYTLTIELQTEYRDFNVASSTTSTEVLKYKGVGSKTAIIEKIAELLKEST